MLATCRCVFCGNSPDQKLRRFCLQGDCMEEQGPAAPVWTQGPIMSPILGTAITCVDIFTVLVAGKRYVPNTNGKICNQ